MHKGGYWSGSTSSVVSQRQNQSSPPVSWRRILLLIIAITVQWIKSSFHGLVVHRLHLLTIVTRASFSVKQRITSLQLKRAANAESALHTHMNEFVYHTQMIRSLLKRETD